MLGKIPASVAWEGTILNRATEVDNGRGRKRLRHDPHHLPSQRKFKKSWS